MQQLGIINRKKDKPYNRWWLIWIYKIFAIVKNYFRALQVLIHIVIAIYIYLKFCMSVH